MLVQDQAAQTRTFETITESDNGRSLTSAMVVESTRTETGHVELELLTSHSPRHGYSISVNRPRVDDYSRRYVFSFQTTDQPTLKLDFPSGKTRLNRNELAALHKAARQAIEADLNAWLAWAEKAEPIH